MCNLHYKCIHTHARRNVDVFHYVMKKHSTNFANKILDLVLCII